MTIKPWEEYSSSDYTLYDRIPLPYPSDEFFLLSTLIDYAYAHYREALLQKKLLAVHEAIAEKILNNELDHIENKTEELETM